MNTDHSPTLEKGTTSRPAWLSDYDLQLLEDLQRADTGMKQPSISYLLRIALRSTAHRIKREKASLKEVVAEALTRPTGTAV